MLGLGRSLLYLLAWAAGLGLVGSTAVIMAELRDGSPVSGTSLAVWAACVLMLIPSLAVRYWLGRWQRSRDAMEVEQMRIGRAYAARARAGWFIGTGALLAFFLVAAALVIRDGKWDLAAGACALIALFAWLGWTLLRQVLQPGPMLGMDAHGINHAMYGMIPWGEVVGMELVSAEFQGSIQHTLVLGVRRPMRFLRRAPELTRWLHRQPMRHWNDVGPLPIPLNLLDRNPQLIHRAALSLRLRHRSPFLMQWHRDMEPDHVEALLQARVSPARDAT